MISKRIIFEVVIIASIFAFINFNNSDSRSVFADNKKPAEWGAYWAAPQQVMAVDKQTAMKWAGIWAKAIPEAQIKIAALGYDTKAMKLYPFDVTTQDLKSIYDSRFLGYISQASFRGSVVSSTNDLEKRIRKLENTVNKIIGKCCPEAE